MPKSSLKTLKELPAKKQKKVHGKLLISLILKGDKPALEELIRRYKKNKCLLNPKMGKISHSLLQLTARYNLVNFSITLLHYGAEVNAQDKLGNTPLHEAAINGSTLLVNQLLLRGAKQFTQNIYGNTAGMLAARRGHIKLALHLHPCFFQISQTYFFHPIFYCKKMKMKRNHLI